MSRIVIKFDEGALQKANVPESLIQTIRHLVAQVGLIKFETTLPEVASMADGLAPRVDSLTITLTQTNQSLSVVEADAAEHQFVDASIARRLHDVESSPLEQLSRAALIRLIEELQADRASLDFNLADIIRRISQLEDA